MTPPIRVVSFNRLDAGRLLARADLDIGGVTVVGVRLLRERDENGDVLVVAGPRYRHGGEWYHAATFSPELADALRPVMLREYEARTSDPRRVVPCRHCGVPLRYERGIRYEAATMERHPSHVGERVEVA